MNCIHAYLIPWQSSLIRELTNVTILHRTEIHAEKPDFAFLQLSSDTDAQKRFHLANQLLRAKVPMALLDAEEEHLPYLKKLAQTAHRNRVPVILLGSFRFIPAVAALKEVAVSGVLGKITSATINMQRDLSSNPLNQWRLSDAAQWCAELPPQWDDTPPQYDATITIQGTTGKAITNFSLDGFIAGFFLQTPSCTHQRLIPTAEPAVSEMAVLMAELDDDTRPTPKIKSIPMMMEL